MNPTSWNHSNKTLIIGNDMNRFLESTDSSTGWRNVFKITEPICQRVVIVLEEWQHLEGKVDVPAGTSVFIVTPYDVDTSSVRVEYIFDNHVKSRTYGTKGKVAVETAGSAYNKQTQGSIKNKDVAGKVRNQETEWNILNEVVGWDVWNLRTIGDIDNHGNCRNVKNSNSHWYIRNRQNAGDITNSHTFWDIWNIFTKGDVINDFTWWDIKNTCTWWRVANIRTWWNIENNTKVSWGWGVTYQDTVGETTYSSDDIDNEKEDIETGYPEQDEYTREWDEWDDDVPF